MRRAYRLCALLLCVLLLCACTPNDTPQNDDTPAPDVEDDTQKEAFTFPIAPREGSYSYPIVRKEESSAAERDALLAIRRAMETAYGKGPMPETQYTTADLSEEEIAARVELLVGRTGRPESETVYAALGENEYTIRTVGNKLVVLGKTDALTTFAVKAFENMIKTKPQTLKEGYNMTDSYIAGTFSGKFDFDGLGYERVPDVYFETRKGEDVDSILYLTSQTHHYTYGYYSNNAWATGDVIILARSARENPVDFGAAELIAVDVTKEKAWSLGITARGYSEFVVDNELVYYVNGAYELRCFNMLTKVEHTVITKKGINFPHITANGSHINLSLHEGGLDRGFVVDVKTGESDEIMAVRFAEPYPIANHHMICPTDPTVMFFSHEGTTTDIPDRLWIAKLGEEPYNIAYQRTNDAGKPIDCFGHEYWAPDGKGLYFVKYSCSPSAPKGVCYVSLDDIEHPQVLYSKYPYWHVSCSPDQRYIVSDTQSGGYSGVCLIDTETDTEIMLYRAQTYNWTHPAHPHPCVNTASDIVAFNDYNVENGKVAVGFYVVE